MALRFFTRLILAVLLFSGCKSGKDVLATVNDRPVERNELREWAEARKISPDLLRTDQEARKNMLKQLALEIILSEKAAAEGFENNPDYIKIKDTVYRNFLASYYNSRHFRKLKFAEKCADISIIRIFFKGAAGGADFKSKEEIINNIILPALNSGEDFGSLARKYSMDSARSKGGSLGFVLIKMLEDDLQPEVLALQNGSYTLKPVVTKNSLCLIRLNRMVDLTEANIEQYITDKAILGRINAYIRRQAVEISENALKNNPGIVSNLSKARFNSDSELLFSVSGSNCTVGDVKKILNIFYMLKNNEKRKTFPVDEMKFTAERMFREALISSEAVRLGYADDPEFKKKWEYLERATLTGMYKSSYIVNNVNVSKEEVEAGFRSAVLNNKTNKAAVKNQGSLKDSVSSRIYKSKFKKLKDTWEKNLLAENRYVLTGVD